jgi:hypothetical protein
MTGTWWRRGVLTAMALGTAAMFSGCGTDGLAAAPGMKRLAAVPGAMIQMRRAGCTSGQCPVYGVSIFPDRTVVFDGEANRGVTGQRRLTISPDQMRALQLAIEQMHFLDSTDECCSCPNQRGGRYVVLDYRPGFVSKTVVHDQDCPSAPPAMTALERLIDEATGLAPAAEIATRPAPLATVESAGTSTATP